MPKTETSHFWVGHVPKQIAGKYFVEVYDEDDEDREHTPLSAFARDQGVDWYDHDLLEYGWGKAKTIPKLVAGYSYNEQWAEELAQRAEAAALTGVNFFVFISKGEIKRPRSVHGEGYWLYYLGTIRYHI